MGKETRRRVEVDQPAHAGLVSRRGQPSEPDLRSEGGSLAISRKIRTAHGLQQGPESRAPQCAKIGRKTRGAEIRCRPTPLGTVDARAPRIVPGAVDLASVASILSSARRDEGRKAIGVLTARAPPARRSRCAQGSESVGRANKLERRIGDERTVQHRRIVRSRSAWSPNIDVPSCLEPGKRGQRTWPGMRLPEAVEIGLRHEMVDDVDIIMRSWRVRRKATHVPSPACGGGTGRGQGI